MINKLRQRELTGKPIKINYVYPLRDTKYVCYLCNQKIKGLIIDLPNDIEFPNLKPILSLWAEKISTRKKKAL